MCGRMTLRTKLNVLLTQFAIEAAPPDYIPREFTGYNIPPTSELPIVRLMDGTREVSLARWGLLPRWTKDIKSAPMLNNARAESISEKPSFRSAYKSRRCIIPASGFYEWQTEGATKQPFYFRSSEGKLLAFAGLWERWQEIESCTIVTTDANEVMAPIHHRMPVILGVSDYEGWLDPNSGDVSHMLAPCPSSELTCYPVSTYVNKVSNQGQQCIEAVAAKSNVLFD
jgi:putative SOS response-associated peptidase YedK